MKLLVLGYSQAGKSTAAAILAEVLHTKYLNTSDQLMKELSVELGISEECILANKSHYRMQLFKLGRSRQETDPLWPQPLQLQEADILTGLRSPDEVAAAREHNLYDSIIWVSRDGYVAGDTDKLSPDCADIEIKNDGDIADLRLKLLVLIKQLQDQIEWQISAAR